MTAMAAIVGYLIGSVPTADGLGRLKGVRLTEGGSGNPGTNNALRLGGPLLAASVLAVEFGKGVAAVWLGGLIADEVGAVVAGLGAIAGNVYNVWYRFRGGKGLGITGGVLLALWPTVLIPAILIIITGVLVTRSSGAASLIALGGLILLSLSWWMFDWPTGWGIETSELLVATAAVISLMLWRKHLLDYRIKRQRRPEHPAQV